MKGLSERVRSLGKIILTMYLLTAVLLFLLALLVQRFQLDSGAISAGICAVYVLSCFPGGFLAGKVCRSKKFLWGLLTGVFYIAVMSGITLLTQQGFTSGFSGFFLSLLLCIGAGMLGGMLS